MKPCLILIFLSTARIAALAQAADTSAVEIAGMYLAPQMGYPLDKMGTVFPGWCSGGLSVGILNSFSKSSKKPSPFLFGFDLSYLDFGSDRVTSSTTTSSSYYTHYIYGAANILGRVRPPAWKSRFIPFADVILGFSGFVSIVEQTEPNYKEYDDVRNWKFSGGVGLGVNYYTGKTRHFSLLCRVIRQWGNNNDYIVRHSTQETNGQLTYTTDQFATNIFFLEFGVQIHFLEKSPAPK